MNNTSNADEKISVTMISNAMSHHQVPFCVSMNEIEDVSFHFIATKPIAQERLDIGYRDLNNDYDFIVRSYESQSEYANAVKLANESDFVIYGSAPFGFIKTRIKNGKWTFIYSERLFKEVRNGDFLNIKTIAACILRYALVSHKHLRLLCSSAFASNDYRYFGFEKIDSFKWGYFPPNSNLDYEKLKEKKSPNTIIWVGRMIDLKHAELALALAKKLKDENIPFHLNLVGDGPMAQTLKSQVEEYQLKDYVSFIGVLNTDQTRNAMEQSQILITTSDHNEGWGAVVNEGMTSGCAVVASHLMGSVPFLINDGENGRIFESGNANDLFSKVRELLLNPDYSEKLAENAYKSIKYDWNGKTAAERLTELMKQFKNGNEAFVFDSGICSYAPRLKNNWFHSER